MTLNLIQRRNLETGEYLHVSVHARGHKKRTKKTSPAKLETFLLGYIPFSDPIPAETVEALSQEDELTAAKKMRETSGLRVVAQQETAKKEGGMIRTSFTLYEGMTGWTVPLESC